MSEERKMPDLLRILDRYGLLKHMTQQECMDLCTDIYKWKELSFEEFVQKYKEKSI